MLLFVVDKLSTVNVKVETVIYFIHFRVIVIPLETFIVRTKSSFEAPKGVRTEMSIMLPAMPVLPRGCL